MPNQEKLKIEFEDGGTIYLEGSPDVVKPAYSALSAEVARLQSEMSSESVKVPINLHRHIIGKSGASGKLAVKLWTNFISDENEWGLVKNINLV